MLFEPFVSRDVTARNRIVASPMCQYAADDGALTDWHVAHLGRLAIGGSGIVFVEETAVERRGRKTQQCAGLWSDMQMPSFRRVAHLLTSIGATPAIQLGHAGRRASTQSAEHEWAPLPSDGNDDGAWQAVAPSPVPVDENWPVPHPLSRAEIHEVVQHFADAARRAQEAGYQVLEVHGAHGYLIHQFLSPIANQRTDAYGGSLRNRMRFALEITEAVRAVWPDRLPLFFRVSARDGRGGVWDLPDTIVLARTLRTMGVDLVDCSSGGISGPTSMTLLPRTPGYQVEFARAVREQAGVPTMAVGLITEPAQADKILNSGSADVIGLARELLAHSDWPVAAARELGLPPWDVLPAGYAFRLKRRDVVSAMPFNRVRGLDEPPPSDADLLAVAISEST